MTLAVFYHLTRSGLDQTVAMIATRAQGQGWRVMIRSRNPTRLADLDDALWRDPEDGFLPHGREDAPGAADQPILLGQGDILNQARGLVLLDGAETTAGEARSLDRVWVVFDGNADSEVTQARGLWKLLTEAGLGAQYWSEDTGRWQMKTERAAVPVGAEEP